MTRFVADAMLGSLARKLRALGFDTTYYRTGEDAGLVAVARREGRIILTSDRGLAARARSEGAEVILLSGGSDPARISAIAEASREWGRLLVRGPPLCSLCGGSLLNLRKEEASGEVPSSVVRRHRLFFRCVLCGQIYWRGSHWKKLRSLARRLDRRNLATQGRGREKGRTPCPGDPRGPRRRGAPSCRA